MNALTETACVVEYFTPEKHAAGEVDIVIEAVVADDGDPVREGVDDAVLLSGTEHVLMRVCCCELRHFLQIVGKPTVVSIEEGNELTRGFPNASVTSRCHSLVLLEDIVNPLVMKGRNNLGAMVCRAIVDNNDLKVGDRLRPAEDEEAGSAQDGRLFMKEIVNLQNGFYYADN